jgi:group I intron endonuclease
LVYICFCVIEVHTIKDIWLTNDPDRASITFGIFDLYMMIGIYKIKSIIKPEKIYIGSTLDIKHRWNIHLSLLKRNKHHSIRLQNHINKYGLEDLQFSILLYGCQKEELLFIEQIFIDNYIPFFNICKTAGSQLGNKRNKETRLKLSLANKGKKTSDETKIKIGQFQLGNKNLLGFKHSEETKIEMSKNRKGIKRGIYKKHGVKSYIGMINIMIISFYILYFYSIILN